MSSKDFEIAGKIGEFVSRFSTEWSEYQDWLRDIVTSRSILRERYPAWLTTIVFRWRLCYFAAYVGTVIIINRLLKRLEKFRYSKDYVDLSISSESSATTVESDRLEQYSYLLQRTATLLAVAELTLCLIAACTGIMLSFYYQPTALGAYKSLTVIVNEVSNGSLILSLHNFAGNSLIVLALVQIVVMFLGRQQLLLSWLAAWISGVCLALTAISLSWTAIVLNWSQISFWRFKIELSIIASIPLGGSILRNVLLGGNGINSTTVQHMYALHSHILIVVAVFLSVTHLSALIFQEQNCQSKAVGIGLAKLCRDSVDGENSRSA